MENPFREKHEIFNGQFRLITEDNEFRMSLWVKGFGIEDKNGNVIMELVDSFNLNKSEEAGNILKVNFSVFPKRSAEYNVEIDPFQRTFLFNSQAFPLEKIKSMFIEMTGE